MKTKTVNLSVDEYKKILINHKLEDTLWGRFEEIVNCVTIPDLSNGKVFLVFDTEEDAVMFKLRYM
jgi:hypothetical protein